MGRLVDLAGKRFGRLLVVCRGKNKQKNRHAMWTCVCDCGSSKDVSSCHLASGKTRSCGCYQAEVVSLPGGVASRNATFGEYKNRARKKNLEFLLTLDEFVALAVSRCIYCGSVPKKIRTRSNANGGFLCNGIDRVNNDIGYTVENSVACCETCNRAKLKMTKTNFLEWIDQVYNYQHFHTDRSCNPIKDTFWKELEAA